MGRGTDDGERSHQADVKTRMHRRAVVVAGGLVVLAALWFAHGVVLGSILQRVLPWWGARAGWDLSIGEVQVRLFAPVVLRDVAVRASDGTDLKLATVVVGVDGRGRPGASARRWLGSVEMEGVSGLLVLPVGGGPEEPGREQTSGIPRSRLAWLPRVAVVRGGNLSLRAGAWTADARDVQMLLSENQAGEFRLSSLTIRRGGRGRTFEGLHAVTAWRDGTAYLSDLQLDGNVTIDAVSAALVAAPALTLEARAFGGYVYADLASAGGRSLKAALTAVDLSVAEAAAFASLSGDMEGRVALAKLTFIGDPAQWMSAQVSLRVEAGEFSWRGNTVEELRIGASLSGRRLRVNEFLMRQEGNAVKLRGTASVPRDPAAWREVPVEVDVTAQVGKVQALAGLFGAPWSELSGGLQIEGALHGKAGDGDGWLRLRGWDLRVPGIPPTSLQADLRMQGRNLQVAGLGAQSGSNFLQGHGRVSLEQPAGYQGRLELRVREVAAYLDRLGRLAPDWAREGGVLLFWDGDGTGESHSGVVSLELVKFTGDLNPVPVNAKLSATYAPGNIYVSRVLLDRGPLSLSSSFYFGEKGLAVQGMQLFSGRTRLLVGEMSLPLSLEALLDRRPWPAVVLPGGDIYARVRSDDMDLASLVALFGQQTSLRGRVDLRLDASGSWAEPVADGSLAVEGLRARFPSFSLPESRLEGSLQVKDRHAVVGVMLTPKGAKRLSLEARLPLAPKVGEAMGDVFDRSAPWDARLDVPVTRVDPFGLKPGGFPLTDGTFQASIQGSGTMAAPRLHGSLAWEGVHWRLTEGWNPWRKMKGRLAFEGTKAVLEEAGAEVGAGRLHWSGSADFAEFGSPELDLRMQGESVPVFSDETFRLQLSGDLHALGRKAAGRITGTVDVAGSEALKGIAVDAGLRVPAGSAAGLPAAMALRAFDGWQLDVEVTASSPLPVGGGADRGWLEPALYLQGTAASPLLLGSVRAGDLKVGLPSGAFLQAGGTVHFTRALPWRPVLDISGSGRLGSYELRAGAFGPLDERKLFLSSEPPLSLAQLVILLDTGIAPTSAVAEQVASLTPGAGLPKPSWPGLEKLRDLLGWGGGVPPAAEGREGVADGGDLVGYEWTLQ